MRLYDDISASIPDIEKTAPGFSDATVVDITEVLDWSEATFGSGPLSPDAITRAIPPFKHMWCEWRNLLSDDSRRGMLVSRTDDDATPGGHTLTFSTFMSSSVKAQLVYIGRAPRETVLHANQSGDRFAAEGWFATPEEDTDILRHHRGWIGAVLLACRFMNARGVEMVEGQAPRHERRQAERNGWPAPTKFYTLTIRPITHRLETEGRVKEVGLARALHLCRGHFADYTQGAGLFGKYKTEVFVPEHVRGSRERGEIVKDYSVKP